MTTIALTRHVPSSFVHALAATPPDAPIDVALAREQHAAYCKAVGSLGARIVTLGTDEGQPDCCFIEDTAVVGGGVALVTNPGAPSRRGEVDDVAIALAKVVEVVRMKPPAQLDGGDCMRVGKTIYAGRSARTNAAGIDCLAQVFGERGFRIVPVELPREVLHLKCVCAPLGDDRITLAEHMPRNAFRDVNVIAIPEVEAYAANVVAMGNRVLVPEGFPTTCELLARAGFDVTPVATTEFRKADGALTCLSILLEAA